MATHLINSAECASPSCLEEARAQFRLAGKSVAMVLFSSYPDDPRPRRAAEALLKMGMTVDLLCEACPGAPRYERHDQLSVTRMPVRHSRGGFLSYVYEYFAFTLLASLTLARRSLRRRYDLVYVHNMPDALVFCALFPQLLGAKIILDQHDPMPELMNTLFGMNNNSFAIRLVRTVERWSIRYADLVITVNLRCKHLFAERSCSASKIGVVMNSPDEEIFPVRSVTSYTASTSEESFVIMFHGSLVKRNGLGLAVRALELVRRNVPSAILRIYGKRTDYLEEVLEEARELGIERAIIWHGPKSLEQLVHEIQACHVGIIPNERNTFTNLNTPTRIFEYLVLGKPVIAPDTPGIRDYFPPDSLHFFEVGSAEHLAAQIVEVYSHPTRTARITERGQDICLQHSWRKERLRLVSMVADLLVPVSPITDPYQPSASD
jgi:glycosyltransferase involved in cell wall biosynthesis